jgi:hypothetical protein
MLRAFLCFTHYTEPTTIFAAQKVVGANHPIAK